MLPDALKGPEARFLLLTTAFEEAIRCSRWTEAQIFLDERATLLPEITRLGGPSKELLEKLNSIDAKIQRKAEATRNSIGEAQSRIQTHRKAISAYQKPSQSSRFKKAS